MARKSTLMAGVMFLTILLVSASAANAFRPGMSGNASRSSDQLGIRAGYDFEVDVWSVGGQLRFPARPGGALQLITSSDLFFVEGRKDWQINLDTAIQERGGAYYGGGLAFANRDFRGNGEHDFKTGGNLLLGMVVRLRHSSTQPYLEGRWTFIEGERLFRLVAGLNFTFGGSRR